VKEKRPTGVEQAKNELCCASNIWPRLAAAAVSTAGQLSTPVTVTVLPVDEDDEEDVEVACEDNCDGDVMVSELVVCCDSGPLSVDVLVGPGEVGVFAGGGEVGSGEVGLSAGGGEVGSGDVGLSAGGGMVGSGEP
jgi:hypothetical protein